MTQSKGIIKDRLRRSIEELEEYLTGYRKQTSHMALIVLNQTEDVYNFLDMETSLTIVRNIIHEDVHRTHDIAKMLTHTMRGFKLDDTLPDDIKQLMAERKGNRKNIKLVLV